VANRNGSILFETALVILLLTAVLYRSHTEIAKRASARLEKVESDRLPYDGEILWKP
jgi:hypothetical protein